MMTQTQALDRHALGSPQFVYRPSGRVRIAWTRGCRSGIVRTAVRRPHGSTQGDGDEHRSLGAPCLGSKGMEEGSSLAFWDRRSGQGCAVSRAQVCGLQPGWLKLCLDLIYSLKERLKHHPVTTQVDLVGKNLGSLHQRDNFHFILCPILWPLYI